MYVHFNAFNGVYLTIAATCSVSERIAHIYKDSSASVFREPLWNIIKPVRLVDIRYGSEIRTGERDLAAKYIG
jgi:hypothetical protein